MYLTFSSMYQLIPFISEIVPNFVFYVYILVPVEHNFN